MAGSSLQERIDRALNEAVKARDRLRISSLRMIRAALHNRRIEKRTDLDDGEVLQVLSTWAKQRREAIEQFRSGGRDDLADKEAAELAVAQEFLPGQLADEDLRALVAEAVAATGAGGPRDMGRVMGALMPRVRGRADGKRVNQLVREALATETET